MSHVTRHMSHVTRHTSYVTCLPSAHTRTPLQSGFDDDDDDDDDDDGGDDDDDDDDNDSDDDDNKSNNIAENPTFQQAIQRRGLHLPCFLQLFHSPEGRGDV